MASFLAIVGLLNLVLGYTLGAYLHARSAAADAEASEAAQPPQAAPAQHLAGSTAADFAPHLGPHRKGEASVVAIDHQLSVVELAAD